MFDISEVLGLNARSQNYLLRYNNRQAKKIADSKLIMWRVLEKANIPTPKVYKKFKNTSDIVSFDWERLPDSFALKPSRGFGGEGIIVVKKKLLDEENGNGPVWMTTQKTLVKISDLKLHVLDILEGAYSIGSIPDVAFIQEYVGRHKAFRKYSYRGTPDIRVIVFNKIPIMAMLRLPTKESGGRANLHQGALGVGVDIATGITTKAIHHGNLIKFKPGSSKRKLHGIKIPFWTRILTVAVEASQASGLVYSGVDLVLHPEKGPMVLELNARPGLQIQLANMAGLKRRLERIKDLEVKDAEHGVKIAKIIFAERFADKVKLEEGVKTLKPIERVKIYSPIKKGIFVNARIDTGAVRTSLDRNLAESLGLLSEDNILWRRKYAYRSAHGKQSRPVIALTIRLAGRKIKTSASVADRSKLSTLLLIGRNDLVGFLISPSEENVS